MLKDVNPAGLSGELKERGGGRRLGGGGEKERGLRMCMYSSQAAGEHN
jgi:hypothetical protein